MFSNQPQIGYPLVILHTLALPLTRRPSPGTGLYNSDVPDSAPLSIHCKSASFGRFTGDHHLLRVRGRDPNPPYFLSKSDLYKYFMIDSDTQMYLCESSLSFLIDWNFPLGHMSMDLCSVLTALFSHGVPFVTGSNIQVASPQGCTPGPAGPERSVTFIHPGQHVHHLVLTTCELAHWSARVACEAR